jgi:hypothetical protein
MSKLVQPSTACLARTMTVGAHLSAQVVRPTGETTSDDSVSAIGSTLVRRITRPARSGRAL